MSQNVTLLATISRTQTLAIEALASGSNITGAASAAGVARETVSRWVQHDATFIAELRNARAELAAQTRSALESLGMRSVATLRDALQNEHVRSTRLRAACAVLKMLGADKPETLAPTTPLEMDLLLRDRDAKLRELQVKLEARDGTTSLPTELAAGSEPVRSEATTIEATQAEPDAREEDTVDAVSEPETNPTTAAEVPPMQEGDPSKPVEQGVTTSSAETLGGWPAPIKADDPLTSMLRDMATQSLRPAPPIPRDFSRSREKARPLAEGGSRNGSR